MPLPKSPSPQWVAKKCMKLAWKDDIPDIHRFVLEAAHDVIRDLMLRNMQLARKAERHEADAARLFFMHFGTQKGGAS